MFYGVFLMQKMLKQIPINLMGFFFLDVICEMLMINACN